jgi:hypothetical protein
MSTFRLHWRQRRQARVAGAIISQVSLQRSERQNRNADITLSSRDLDKMFIAGGVAILTLICVDLVMAWNRSIPPVLGWSGCLVLLVVLFLVLWQWAHLPPLLCVSSQGIQYICPPSAVAYNPGGVATRNVMLTRSEIGAIGCIQDGSVSSLVVYASARRWRSGWAPSMRIPQKYLPLPVNCTRVIKRSSQAGGSWMWIERSNGNGPGRFLSAYRAGPWYRRGFPGRRCRCQPDDRPVHQSAVVVPNACSSSST